MVSEVRINVAARITLVTNAPMWWQGLLVQATDRWNGRIELPFDVAVGSLRAATWAAGLFGELVSEQFGPMKVGVGVGVGGIGVGVHVGPLQPMIGSQLSHG